MVKEKKVDGQVDVSFEIARNRLATNLVGNYKHIIYVLFSICVIAVILIGAIDYLDKSTQDTEVGVPTTGSEASPVENRKRTLGDLFEIEEN